MEPESPFPGPRWHYVLWGCLGYEGPKGSYSSSGYWVLPRHFRQHPKAPRSPGRELSLERI